jgi:hypothetical protein
MFPAYISRLYQEDTLSIGQLFIIENFKETVLNDYLALKIFMDRRYKCTIHIQ